MKTSGLKVGGVFSMVMASTLMLACGAGDMNGFDGAEGDMSDEGDYSEELELGSLEQGIHNCSTPDGTNAVMAALAVSAGQELKRWRAGLDFEKITVSNVNNTWGDVIRLTSGTGSDGKPRGKSRCANSSCPKVEALLALQYANATGVYVQAESSTTKIQVTPNILQGRMVAKLQEQITKDIDARDADLNQSPKTAHTLSVPASPVVSLSGCGSHYKFNVAFDAVAATAPKPVPAQLKWALSFADQQNGWVDFKDLGGGVVAIDPTYGLNEDGTTTAGTCAVACTKVSTTNIATQCCSCGGVQKKFVQSAFSTAVFLCQ